MVIGLPFAFGGKAIEEELVLGKLFVKLIRRNFPHYRIVQIADDVTQEIDGVDFCYRQSQENDWGVWYFTSLLNFPKGSFLRLDYDTVIKKDVEDVFDEDFDIAIAREARSTLNNGVMFIKNREIFVHALGYYVARTGRDGWGDLQKSTQMAIDSGKYKVARLDRDTYNNTDSQSFSSADSKILHYKGWRKKMMLKDYA